MNEATARIKINKLLEEAGWRFFAEDGKPANILLESGASTSFEIRLLSMVLTWSSMTSESDCSSSLALIRNRNGAAFKGYITSEEFDHLRSQSVISSWGGQRYHPHGIRLNKYFTFVLSINYTWSIIPDYTHHQ